MSESGGEPLPITSPPQEEFEQFLDVIERIGGKSVGAVRISLGMVSNLDDVGAVVDFARNLLDKRASTL